MSSEVSRCLWASGPYPQPYHDREWGVPVHDDRRHFEFLALEAAQAGLKLAHDPEASRWLSARLS